MNGTAPAISFQYTTFLHLTQRSFVFFWNLTSFNQHVATLWRKLLSGRTEHTFVVKRRDLEWKHKHFEIIRRDNILLDTRTSLKTGLLISTDNYY